MTIATFKPRGKGKAHKCTVDENGRIKKSRSVCGHKVYDDWRIVVDVNTLQISEKCAKCFNS